MKNQKISLIVAMTEDRLIGRGNAMPWHLSEDLKLFKSITIGNTVIMGRKTYESMGKPLPQRTNIVISSSFPSQNGVVVARSFALALDKARSLNQDIFIIGGGTIYQEALSQVEYMHISWVKEHYAGDTFFPEFDLEEWQVLEKKEYAEFIYCVYKRIEV